jgi:hypothetical protein
MYNYEEIRDELKKNRYNVYVIENQKYKLALKFNGTKSELKEKLKKKYLKKNKPDMFFVCFKFSFHTGTKSDQGGPLAIKLSTLLFIDDELVNGFTYNEKCRKIVYTIWFQRKYLEKNGWSDTNFDIIIGKLLSGKTKLYPLVINMFNVKFLI